MLKRLTFGASIAALALGLAASAAYAEDKPVYGVLMKTLSNPFWGAMEKGVDAGAKNAGVDIFLEAVESDQAAEPQLNACNTMLQKKPVAMITAAINSTILLPCLKQANEMKIPVVDLDNNLDPAITKKAGVDIAFHIGSDNEAAGAKGADYLVSALGKDAKGPVLVIEGLSGNITGEKRARVRRRAEEAGARPQHRRLFAGRLGQSEGRQHHQRHAAAQSGPRRHLLRQ
jgi:ABC-type sugar transport system substrate-binding protein